MASNAKLVSAGLFAAGLMTAAGAHALEAEAPVLVSHTPAGIPTQGGICSTPSLSRDGRFTSFSCYAYDIIPGEPGVGDAMLHDERTDSIVGLSYTDIGEWGDCHGAEFGTCASYAADIAVDGSEVVLNSGAPLLDSLPQPLDYGYQNVFLRNTVAGTTEWLTPPPGAMGNGGPVATDASVDRHEILIATDADFRPGAGGAFGKVDLFVVNWRTQLAELVTVSPDGQRGNGNSTYGRFSPDGRFVVFLSYADNLTDDNPQHLYNLFLRDRLLKTTRRLTFPWHGGEFSSQPNILTNARITADNRHVVFSSSGTEFTRDSNPAVPLAVYDIDLTTGETQLISRGVNGEPLTANAFSATFSDDGRYMAFNTSATNVSDAPGPLPAVFVRDRVTGETINVSASLGTPPDPLGRVTISADGSKVAFEWPKWSAIWPTLLDNRQIYTVRLRSDPSPSPAVAVPAASRPVLLILAGFLAGAVAVLSGYRRSARACRQ